MKKTGLKTFTISFALTLFVVFSINGLCVRERKISDKKYIPQKNISLFFKQKSETSFASIAPIKKINLSILEEDLNVAEASRAEVIPLDLSREVNDEVSVASLEDLYDSPIVLAKEDQNAEAAAPPASMIESTASIANTEKETASSPEVVLAELLPAKYNPEDADETSLIPLEKSASSADASVKTHVASMEKSNQIAMNHPGKDIKNMAADGVDALSEFDDEPQKEVKWETMKETRQAESPWVVAKGAKHPKNSMVLEADYAKEKPSENVVKVVSGSKEVRKETEVVASAEMVKNILIPIPKDIAAQDPLIPQLMVEDGATESSVKAEQVKEAIDEEKGGFLSGLKNIFSNSKEAEQDMGPSEFDGVDDELYAKLKKNRNDKLTLNGGEKKTPKILPTEMRLSFQPNRAEISGQTLKWINAFANKINEEQGLVLEVRIDSNSSQELQQKRLTLLGNILTNKGMDLNRVKTVFTAREPNSFVIRAVRLSETRNNLLVQKAKNKRETPYYQQGRGAKPDNYQQW